MIVSSHGPADQAGNLLLARLPLQEWQQLRPKLQSVELKARSLLYERNQDFEFVYFPRKGCVSLIVDLDDGFQAEAGVVGYEGMVGVPLLHGIKADAASAVVQVPTEALRMPAAIFVREFRQLPAFERLLLRYGEVMRTQAMQIAACNGHHSLDARLARCILTMQDRYRGRDLPVTHEAFASLLCAHRPSVSVAAKRLQQMGAIRYSAGHVLITDRDSLENASCECYRAMRDHTQSVLGMP